MKDSRKRIAVDMDEVLADAVGEMLLRYNRDFGEHLTRDQLHGRWMWDLVPEERQPRLLEYLHSEDFFSDLAVLPESQRVLERLTSHYEVFIASAAMEFPYSLLPKYRWLRRHFPFLQPGNFVFCGDKGILNAEYLVDDMPRHFKHFSGQGLLFTAGHNALLRGYTRVADWLDVERYFFPRGPRD